VLDILPSINSSLRCHLRIFRGETSDNYINVQTVSLFDQINSSGQFTSDLVTTVI
jgi:hypothetical protein